jgi:Alpha/beta hydrolase domain
MSKKFASALAVAVLAGSLLSVVAAAPAIAHSRATARPAASAATPTVSGPVTGGAGAPSLAVGTFSLASVGYSEAEYFLSGTATAYTNTAPLGADGKWSVAPASRAAYKTRVVVLRPKSARDFSGTVVVEWLNVSAGQDSPADWALGHDEMIRSGDAYVGVSAQAVGVNALKAIDPARYGSLSHPGDSYSYDIFSQAGQAVRKAAATLMPGLRPRTIVADGESQSAFRLTTYVNAIAPLVNVFDSYLIHSRSASGSALSEAPQPDIETPAVVFTRDDSAVPVLTFQTETDPIILGYLPATQADSKNFRLWEVAGTAHADAYVLSVSAADANTQAADNQLFALMQNPPSTISVGGFTASCTAPFNTGEQHYVYQTALHDLTVWTQTGIAPRHMPRLSVSSTGAYQLDANGNVRGGVRSPAVDTPVATLSGLPPADAPGFCLLFGRTIPFSAAQLAARYPTHQAFVLRWRLSVLSGLLSGYLLPADAVRLYRVVS